MRVGGCRSCVGQTPPLARWAVPWVRGGQPVGVWRAVRRADVPMMARASRETGRTRPGGVAGGSCRDRRTVREVGGAKQGRAGIAGWRGRRVAREVGRTRMAGWCGRWVTWGPQGGAGEGTRGDCRVAREVGCAYGRVTREVGCPYGQVVREKVCAEAVRWWGRWNA
ncbi:hypothetical protein ACFQYP_30385 [Nonomuraea antimicrobica]